jgi:hypothetical protein
MDHEGNTNARIKSCYLDVVSEGSVWNVAIFHVVPKLEVSEGCA